MALEVLKRLNTTGIDAAQLASVKAYVKGLYPTRELETADQVESCSAIGSAPMRWRRNGTARGN